ncbi:MAG TPA: hypothetical protein VEQ36_08960, partial [Thermomicrobiales bacterium]|nr:hypothetical protein [Thermomicrobiales bacterium]
SKCSATSRPTAAESQSDVEGEGAAHAVVTWGGADVGEVALAGGGMDHDGLGLAGVEHNVDAELDDGAERTRCIETVWGTGYRFLPYSM